MKIVAVRPYQYAKIEELEYSLDAMQSFVGGLIEAYYPFDDEVAVICNDEGKINGMDPNRVIHGFSDTSEFIKIDSSMEIIFGNFFICGVNGPDFCSLTEEQASKYLKLFRKPQVIVSMSGNSACKGSETTDLIAVSYEPEE